MVVRMYKTIRECIVSNARIMSETTIQLPEVNAATVTQWYSRRCWAQEKLILNQGIPQPAASMAATEKLPDPLQKGQHLQTGTLAEPHIFVLLPNTAGEAKLKPRPQRQMPAPQNQDFFPSMSSVPIIVQSGSSSQVLVPPILNIPIGVVMPPPAMIIKVSVPPSPQPASNTPYTTQQYRKRKMEAEQMGVTKRKYVKNIDHITCSKCGANRQPPSHRQYFGNWFCEATETQTYDSWRAELEKRGYG